MKNYYNLLSKKLLSMYMLYILIFSIAAYSACFLYVQNNYKKTEQKRAEQLVSNLEDFLSYSTDIAYTLSTNQTVIEYAKSTVLDNSIYPRLAKELTSLEFINDSYRSISIVNIPNKHVMVPNDSMSLEYFNRLYHIEDDTLNNILNSLYSTNKNNVISTILGEAKDKENTAYLATCISCKSDYEKPVIFIFLYNLNEFFNDIPKGSVPCAIELSMKKDNIRILYNEIDEPFISTFDASKFNYKNIVKTSTYSRFFKDIYCSVYVPFVPYLLYINNFFMLLLLALLALFFAGIVYTKNRAKNIYTPIKNLLSILPQGIFNNNTNELDTFKNYISSLESQKNSMKEIISKNKIQLSDRFLIQLMTSTLSKGQIKSGVANYNLKNVNFPVVTFIITYRNYQALAEILSSDGLNEIRFSVHEYFNQNFAPYKFFKLIDIDHQTIAGIVSTDEPNKFYSQLKKVVLSIDMMLDIDLIIYVGKKATSWYEIPDSYSSASNSKNKYMPISDQNIIVSSEEMTDAEFNQMLLYSPENESGLINSVMNIDKVSAKEHIDRIIDTNLKNRILSRDHYSQLVIMLYSTITKILTATNKTEQDLFGEVRIYLELMSSQDVNTLKDKFTSFIFTLISSIENMKKNVENNTAKLMLTYIDENFEKDISLFTLADFLNISHPYASTIFKLKTGQNFKDYLTDFRLSKAIELMENNPMMKITDVAKAVGYSRQTFTRAFTKKYNIPPSNYFQNPEK